ncbi:MAG: hypothetical protein Q8L89_08890 [Gammaproteobacteria bacterium]|nr:hypothetical protein [Gammaproteobacteria bacterium]
MKPLCEQRVWDKPEAHPGGVSLDTLARKTKNVNMVSYAPLHLLLVFMLLAAPLQPLLAAPDSGHSAAASHTSATYSDSTSNEQSHHGSNDCKGAGHACGMCGTHCSALTPAMLFSAYSALPDSPVASPLTFIDTDLSPPYEPPRPV